MELDLLYHKESVHVLNPKARTAIITCWSKPEKVIQMLKDAGCSLDGIACVGTLYGKGFSALLRNLCWNPQIHTLVILGRDRSGTGMDLVRFFKHGTEEVEKFGAKLQMIHGTDRLLDSGVTLEICPTRCSTAYLCGDYDLAGLTKHRGMFKKFKMEPEAEDLQRVRIPEVQPAAGRTERVTGMDEHQITADSALDAYVQLVHRLYTAGQTVELAKGKRVELRNVKVVVRNPEGLITSEERALFDEYLETPTHTWDNYYSSNFNLFNKPDDVDYTYGNRINCYFGYNTMVACQALLRKDPQSRHAYVALFDTSNDMDTRKSVPCLVSLFFRTSPDGTQLNLTATFRTHNAAVAWPPNVFALAKLLEANAEDLGLFTGSLTVFSQSISLDLTDETTAKRAKAIAEEYEHGNHFYEDPNGYFAIQLQDGRILVEYLNADRVLKTWSGKKASVLQHRIHSSAIVGNVGHALYLGRMLERAEQCLRTGEAFVQE